MAWVATENFESGSDASNIAGTGGGSGWSGNWTKEGGGNDWVYEADNALGGLLSAYHAPNNTTDTGVTRNLASSTSSGVIYYKVRRTSASTGRVYLLFRDTGDGYGIVEFNASGNITLQGNTVQAYSANTTYTIQHEFDYSTDQSRVSVDGGTYSSWYSNGAAGTAATKFLFRSADAASGVSNIVDSIGAEETGSTSTGNPHNNLLLLGVS